MGVILSNVFHSAAETIFKDVNLKVFRKTKKEILIRIVSTACETQNVNTKHFPTFMEI